MDVNYELETEQQSRKDLRALYGGVLERALRDLEDEDWYVRYKVSEWFLGDTCVSEFGCSFSFADIMENMHFRPSQRDKIKTHVAHHLSKIRREKIEYTRLQVRIEQEKAEERKRVIAEFEKMKVMGKGHYKFNGNGNGHE